MKNKGCLFTLLGFVAAWLAVYGLSTLAYTALVAKDAKAFSLFHSRTIVFEPYYTVVPTGAWFDRIITIIMFTGLLWFVLWGLLFLAKKLTGNEKLIKSPAKGLFVAMILLVSWSLIATLFVPKRKVIYDMDAQKVLIKDYQSLFHIWPAPIVTSQREVPYSSVTDVRFSTPKTHIMGASHDELELWLITTTDTTVIGASLLYHGEFGWLTHRQSREEVLEAGKVEANQIATRLLALIKKDAD